MKFICRDAVFNDIENLVDLHFSNFNENELSLILGKKFIFELYLLCLRRTDVSIKVIELDTGQLVSSSAIFFKYSNFESDFKAKAKVKFIQSILIFAIHFNFKKISFIFKTLFSRNLSTVINSHLIYDCYVGAFIIAKEFRHEPSIVVRAYKMLSEQINTLKKYSSAGIWGSIRISNNGSLRLLKSLGMNEINKIKSFPEDIYVCIWHK
jgi:hypothetical protein